MMTPMRLGVSVLLWAALLVAGAFASFRLWLRAFDVEPVPLVSPPAAVSHKAQRLVPAVIQRWTTPRHEAAAPKASVRKKAPAPRKARSVHSPTVTRSAVAVAAPPRTHASTIKTAKAAPSPPAHA